MSGDASHHKHKEHKEHKHKSPRPADHSDAAVFQEREPGLSQSEKRAMDSQKWVSAQRKAFLYWVNSQLAKRQEHIDDLTDGFKDGIHLITLVEVLTGKKLQQKWTKRAVVKIHKINNCAVAIEHLKVIGQVNRITISAENFVDGDEENLLLGFCWQLLRKFQGVPGGGDDKAGSFEQGLLAWLMEKTKSYNLDYSKGFKSTALTDGTALLALFNEAKPGVIDFKSYLHNVGSIDGREKNCHDAIDLAQEHLNIPSILDSFDLAHGEASEKNIVLYLSLYYNAFKELQEGDTKDTLHSKIKDLEARIKMLIEENEELNRRKQALLMSTTDLSSQINLLVSQQEQLKVERDECESKLHELRDRYDSLKEAMEGQISHAKAQIQMSSSSAEERQEALRAQIDEAKRERERLRQELEKLKNGLEKENQEMAKHNETLKKELQHQRQVREKLESSLGKFQEESAARANNLRKHLLQHVHDMHNWKIFLEQEKEYISEDLHILMEAELDDLDFEAQVLTLDSALAEENESLQKLEKDRKLETRKEGGRERSKGKSSVTTTTTTTTTTTAASPRRPGTKPGRGK